MCQKEKIYELDTRNQKISMLLIILINKVLNGFVINYILAMLNY